MPWRLQRSSRQDRVSAFFPRPQGRSLPWGLRALLVPAATAPMLLSGVLAQAQAPCNPVIDGTYCASQPAPRPSPAPSGRAVTIQPCKASRTICLSTGTSPARLAPFRFRAHQPASAFCGAAPANSRRSRRRSEAQRNLSGRSARPAPARQSRRQASDLPDMNNACERRVRAG